MSNLKFCCEGRLSCNTLIVYYIYSPRRTLREATMHINRKISANHKSPGCLALALLCTFDCASNCITVLAQA